MWLAGGTILTRKNTGSGSVWRKMQKRSVSCLPTLSHLTVRSRGAASEGNSHLIVDIAIVHRIPRHGNVSVRICHRHRGPLHWDDRIRTAGLCGRFFRTDRGMDWRWLPDWNRVRIASLT